MDDLFSNDMMAMSPGAFYLPGVVTQEAAQLWENIQKVWQSAPPQCLMTPYGLMSSQISNCGRWGWVSDESGYRYSAVNPTNGQAWPAIPEALRLAAQTLAQQCGYMEFSPNCCLINRYRPPAKMGLHRDHDENDISQPIVSISLGLSAMFKFGGKTRKDKLSQIQLNHGDAVVWGAASRLHYHAISRILATGNPVLGDQRINLTFRYVNL